MKDVTLYIKADCPYCRRALAWMEELFSRRPELRSCPLTIVDEDADPETAAKADYYYVPTFFVGGVKVHEGAATRASVERVFEEAARG